MDRRKFLKSITAAGGSLALAGVMKPAGIFASDSKATPNINQKFTAPARHWDKLENNFVKCRLCPRECPVPDKGRGVCKVRENQNGEYKTLVYNRPVTMAVDPIEKKPAYHFLPGTKAFSIATAGCNFECKFCQNWELSQSGPEDLNAKFSTPEDIANAAAEAKTSSVAFTYNEPMIFYEYMYDCAVAAKKKNIHSIAISNGYINEKPLRELTKVLSAIKIDFKGFSEKFYKDICSGELKHVLRTLEILKEEKIWFEIVILIIPGLNDSKDENKKMCKWIVEKLGRDVPVHYSRFHPQYKLKNLPSTPLETLEEIYKIAKGEGINYVYLGNLPSHDANNTYCPSCGKKLIERIGFYIKENSVIDSKCPKCNIIIPGIWK